MLNIKEITTIKERLELKSSLVQYINERVIKYTKLDKHDKAILVLLQENKDLEEDIELYKDMLDQFKKQFERLEKENEIVHKDFGESSEKYFFEKSRNDKAIEYINNYMPNYDFDHYNLEKLLKILKGE